MTTSTVSSLRSFLACAFVISAGALLPAADVDFDRQVRAVLSENCFACHGPDDDAREADLRLDLQESVANHDGLIQKGKPDESELIRRITSDDPEVRMPPADSGKSLTADQIDHLKQWVASGAEWDTHWAFEKPVKPAIPNIDHPSIQNDIDLFTLSKIQAANLEPSPEADRITLVRRLHFDLLGLPPSIADVNAFVRDESPEAYEKLVDSLLASPHFGERMAMYWLDVVRYADSNGYHSDEPRLISPYRDYVINAFNSNKPYDLFVTEQLAGDLMPDATTEHKVASGFNMLLQTTNEGGAQAKEYLAKYSADRVRNTASIFLGVTLGCAECHNHKFDPFTMRDFYSFASYFADISEQGVGNPAAYPVVDDAANQRLAEFNRTIESLQKQLNDTTAEMSEAQKAWEESIATALANRPQLTHWSMLGPFPHDSFDTEFEPTREPVDPGAIDVAAEAGGLKWGEKPDFVDDKVHALSGERQSWFLYREVVAESEQEVVVSLGSDDGIIVWLNGEVAFQNTARRGAAANQDSAKLRLNSGKNQLLIKIVNDGGQAGFYFSLNGSQVNESLAAAITVAAEKRTDEQKRIITSQFQQATPELKSIVDQVAKATADRDNFQKSLPKTLMTVSTKPRTIRLLPRGNWQDDSGEVMSPTVPTFLGDFGLAADAAERATRLDLANWIVHEDNPLTARTFVNRMWKLFYGQGLATPLDDLGAQGVRPTHPELLDYLATEFVDQNWNVKALVKMLVMSATYRQSSVVSEKLKAADPYNQLYARQNRRRLDAEVVRDNALAISGLLVRRIGGDSVKPYQPGGYWRHMNFPTRTWQHDKGENLYRRGLYTWWQRMFLHPSMLAFDAPSREECTVERPRSNTPQQALVLLNDPTYVEAARCLAELVAESSGKTASEQIAWMFQRATSRQPNPEELNILRAIHDKHLAKYRADEQAAKEIASVGERAVSSGVPADQLAALTSAARIILNLHETISRP
ncbi:MAG: PSD1 domain-containing protein [Planctomycetales bacterium]|nr:PSD1 domain-containing protein [Planctomycetales bacterium]